MQTLFSFKPVTSINVKSMVIFRKDVNNFNINNFSLGKSKKFLTTKANPGINFIFQAGGVVTSVGDGIAKVQGLQDVSSGEIVYFFNPIFSKFVLKGLALNLEKDNVGVVILGNDRYIQEGFFVTRSNKMLEVPVGYLLIGAIVDALGVSLDVTGEIINHSKSTMRLIEVKAPGIIPRKSVNEPMRTGLKAVDSMIPIGRGQRELIIGDRQTGKTTIALDAILLNKYSATTSLTNALFSIYVAIGQKRSNIIQLVRNLRRRGAFGLCTIVSATSSDSAALQYLAPYSGCAIGE